MGWWPLWWGAGADAGGWSTGGGTLAAPTESLKTVKELHSSTIRARTFPKPQAIVPKVKV